MMIDHPDRIDMIASGEYPDPHKATSEQWRLWVDAKYPYDSRWRAHLLTRQHRPFPGSAEELDDLRGIRDREQASSLAALWFHLGTREWERARRSTEQHEAHQRAEQERKRREADEQSNETPTRTNKRSRAQAWQE